MATWTQPSEHIRKAGEYIGKADATVDKYGVNIETLPQVTLLVALAQCHTDLAMVKRST